MECHLQPDTVEGLRAKHLRQFKEKARTQGADFVLGYIGGTAKHQLPDTLERVRELFAAWEEVRTK